MHHRRKELAHRYIPELGDTAQNETGLRRTMNRELLVATRNIGYLENPFRAIKEDVRDNYKDKLRAVAGKTIALRDAIQRSVTSEHVRVAIVEPGQEFIPSTMTDEYEGNVAPVEGDKVMATLAIGLVVERSGIVSLPLQTLRALSVSLNPPNRHSRRRHSRALVAVSNAVTMRGTSSASAVSLTSFGQVERHEERQEQSKRSSEEAYHSGRSGRAERHLSLLGRDLSKYMGDVHRKIYLAAHTAPMRFPQSSQYREKHDRHSSPRYLRQHQQ